MGARGSNDTVVPMALPHHNPTPPGAPAWDITFTRVAQLVRPRVEACALGLARRYQAIGFGSEMQVQHTPRGLSIFLSLVGERGLTCIVDMTLVDGMATCQGPCAALDIRLLDACGDVVAERLADVLPGRTGLETATAQALMSDHLDRASTAIYVATLGHFDLLRPIARHG